MEIKNGWNRVSPSSQREQAEGKVTTTAEPDARVESPVTSSASRETEAQKEGTCLFEDESRAEGLGQAMESLSLVSEDKQVVISVLPGLGTAKD